MRPLHVAVLALLTFSGCDIVRNPHGPVAVEAEDPAVLRLVEAASRAEAALRSLAVTRDGEGTDDAPPRVVPPELLEKITIDWIGPLESLAAGLARRAGYRFIEAGGLHPLPLMVTVRADAAPLVLVLRDAGLQAGDAARLTVDAGAKEIRIERSTPEGGDI